MNVNELTLGQIKEIHQLLGSSGADTFRPYELGEDYLIRTVTHINIGTVIAVGPNEIVLMNASWVADTGRYHNALVEGTLSEVEPYPDGQEVIVGRGAVVDATRWLHPLPREQK